MEITEALKQTVVYLNDHLDGAVLALELAYLSDGEVEILVPAVYGEGSAERKKPAARKSVADADTVVVAARNAYQNYLDTEAYVCQPLRSFRDEIRYIGLYKDKAIRCREMTTATDNVSGQGAISAIAFGVCLPILS